MDEFIRLFKITERLNSSSVFKYSTVMIITMFFFSFFDIRLNVILAVFVAFLVIFYLHDKTRTTIDTMDEQHRIKMDVLKPESDEIYKYRDVADFFFSISDFYVFNPPTFEDAIDNTDKFFKFYDDIKKGIINCEQAFEIAANKKQNAINAVHAIIYGAPTSKIVNEKLINSHRRLDKILQGYLDELYDICHRDLLVNGYDSTRNIINTGPKPYNKYLKSSTNATFTYDFY